MKVETESPSAAECLAALRLVDKWWRNLPYSVRYQLCQRAEKEGALPGSMPVINAVRDVLRKADRVGPTPISYAPNDRLREAAIADGWEIGSDGKWWRPRADYGARYADHPRVFEHICEDHGLTASAKDETTLASDRIAEANIDLLSACEAALACFTGVSMGGRISTETQLRRAIDKARNA